GQTLGNAIVGESMIAKNEESIRARFGEDGDEAMRQYESTLRLGGSPKDAMGALNRYDWLGTKSFSHDEVGDLVSAMPSREFDENGGPLHDELTDVFNAHGGLSAPSLFFHKTPASSSSLEANGLSRIDPAYAEDTVTSPRGFSGLVCTPENP